MRERVYIWQRWPFYFRGLARVRYQLARYPSGMDEPRLEQAGDCVYFTDATGVRWRVHDVAYGPPHAKPHHFRRFPSGDQRATGRVFVAAHGERRSYRFERGEARELSAERCERQLAQAGYLARDRFDPSMHGARD